MYDWIIHVAAGQCSGVTVHGAECFTCLCIYRDVYVDNDEGTRVCVKTLLALCQYKALKLLLSLIYFLQLWFILMTGFYIVLLLLYALSYIGSVALQFSLVKG